MRVQNLNALPFLEAGTLWLNTRVGYISETTIRDYQKHLITLAAHFGPLRLNEISGDDIRAYQKQRQARAGPAYINKECSVLQQMLKRIGHWQEIDYEPLLVPLEEREGPGFALTDDQDTRWFRAAFANPNLAVGAHCLRLMANTSMGPGELRKLQLRNLHFGENEIEVPPRAAKNPKRARLIQLNQVASEDVTYLYQRAKGLGARDPEHYLLPFCKHKGLYDLDRPASAFFLQRTIQGLRADTNIRARSYDMRHTAISLLLKNPKVSLMEAKEAAGHISDKMQKRYFHADKQRMRVAMDGLMRKPAVSTKAARFAHKNSLAK